jgi:hypothetical protein
MPFLRPMTVRTVTRAITLAITLAVTGATALVTLAPAHAQPDATSRLVDDAQPARALPTAPATDAATFCPRPSGRWWDDLSVRGCIELLTGRDHTRPLTMAELAWLDLGDLPPYATVDVVAIEASLAAYEQHLADEAAAAAEQAARDAAAAEPRPVARPTRRELPGQPYSDATIDRVLTECGYHDTSPASYEEQERRRLRRNRCIEERMPGYWEWTQSFWEYELSEQEEAEIAEQAAAAQAARDAVYREQFARDVALLEAGIARNWGEAEGARQSILAGARSVSFPFHGWAEQWVAGPLAEGGRHVDRKPYVEHVGSACPNGLYGSYLSTGLYFPPATQPVTVVVSCR